MVPRNIAGPVNTGVLGSSLRFLYGAILPVCVCVFGTDFGAAPCWLVDWSIVANFCFPGIIVVRITLSWVINPSSTVKVFLAEL